jgi:anti-sigma regulatory factor (Ser/Thr protein kinase)
MSVTVRFPIVLQRTFIEATRDTGYRNTAAAVAELVDNAVQAKAKNIRIIVREERDGGMVIGVLDDGTGMDAATLRRALQFGGSARFGDRSGLGRFGMGLPNASVSQARHVDVFTWRAPNACLVSHLDVDDIAGGEVEEIPTVRRAALPKWVQEWRGFSGTLVVWTKCDRLDNRRVSTISYKLLEPLGRMFRHAIWSGVKIWVNELQVSGVDPLFLHRAAPLHGAVSFGEPLTFEVLVPGQQDKTSLIKVRFAELPVAKWHDLPVEEKRKHRIVDAAGLSILRAGREVDYGWWFFGAKRRENYDSWWRGELSFEPELDELFAITHSKQGINPTAELRSILTPDLESVARQLNGRVQAAFAGVKNDADATVFTSAVPSKGDAASSGARHAEARPRADGRAAQSRPGKPTKETGQEYTVSVERLNGSCFFDAKVTGKQWRLVLNSDHSFYHKVYAPLRGVLRRRLEQILLAHAKAEAEKPIGKGSAAPGALRSNWANQLTDLLGEDE